MSLKKQTLWSMLPLLSVTVINFVSVPLFYRYLGGEMYALWGYVMTFSGSFGFMDLGLGVAVGRYIGIALGRGDLDAVRQYWGTANAIALPLLSGMAAVFIVVGTVFGPVWFNVSPAHVSVLRWSFFIGGSGLFLSYYGQFWLILSQANLDFRFLAILRTAVNLLTIVLSIGLAAIAHNPVPLLACASIVGFAQLCIYVYHGRKNYHLGLELRHSSWSRAREMAAYTGKSFAQLLVGSALSSLDRLLLGKVAPPEAFAQYSICANAGGRVVGLSGAVMGPVFHNTTRSLGGNDSTQVGRLYSEVFAFAFPWYLLASIWAALWSPVLLHLWLGQSLGAELARIFPVLLCGCCFTGLANISGAQMGPLNRLGAGLVFQLVSGALLAIGVVVGWHCAGLLGVAWGFTGGKLALVAQDLYVSRLIGARGWQSSRTWRHIAFQSAVALAFSPFLLLASRDSYYLLLPALVHGGFVAAWIMKARLARLLLGAPAVSHALIL